jgi:hypothetical protein
MALIALLHGFVTGTRLAPAVGARHLRDLRRAVVVAAAAAAARLDAARPGGRTNGPLAPAPLNDANQDPAAERPAPVVGSRTPFKEGPMNATTLPSSPAEDVRTAPDPGRAPSAPSAL